eukprot:TRINITY_DN5484_c1_g1_i3.p1 TRINITY_DN5484_c1_g1~~TRINITY_DN5484_c1_g1_i3.p1  ORF type:complete len:143 (-),score=21.45 TRINITY_DN5484_c1_g1_i3:180-608(-)
MNEISVIVSETHQTEQKQTKNGLSQTQKQTNTPDLIKARSRQSEGARIVDTGERRGVRVVDRGQMNEVRGKGSGQGVDERDEGQLYQKRIKLNKNKQKMGYRKFKNKQNPQIQQKQETDRAKGQGQWIRESAEGQGQWIGGR